jgi:tRNA(His) 5'-end guanylyltransferase
MSSMNKLPEGVTPKYLPDGKENPKYVDLLEEDKPIAGQKFVCLSFVSPEKIIKQKEEFLYEEFIKQWDFKKSMEKFTQFLNFIAFKYPSLSFDKLMADFNDFTKEEGDSLKLASSISDDYKTFIDNNEEQLDQKFGELHQFQTSTRGIKVRGVFPTQGEAELRCKLLREVDSNHDIYVGQVGMWVPFHPDAYKTGRVEYMEETLNQLMADKKKNEDMAKHDFEKRVKEAKQKAIEENMKKAEESGNKLTQTINAEGELVGVANVGNFDGLDEDATIDDIKKNMFDAENVVVDKNGDHGLSKLTHYDPSSMSVDGSEDAK